MTDLHLERLVLLLMCLDDVVVFGGTATTNIPIGSPMLQLLLILIRGALSTAVVIATVHFSAEPTQKIIN